jgi:hypothetical protein
MRSSKVQPCPKLGYLAKPFPGDGKHGAEECIREYDLLASELVPQLAHNHQVEH